MAHYQAQYMDPHLTEEEPMDTIRVRFLKGRRRFSEVSIPRDEAATLFEQGVVDYLEPVQEPAEPIMEPEYAKTDIKTCKGFTQSGKPCSRPADGPDNYCWQHSPEED